VWFACEKVNIRPPNVKETWDENNFWTQAEILAYSQIRNLEECEERHEQQKFIAAALGQKI